MTSNLLPTLIHSVTHVGNGQGWWDTHHLGHGQHQGAFLQLNVSSLGALDMGILDGITANITSSNTAIFGAPRWPEEVEGSFVVDTSASTLSLIQGNFSFRLPHSFFPGDIIPTKFVLDSDPKDDDLVPGYNHPHLPISARAAAKPAGIVSPTQEEQEQEQSDLSVTAKLDVSLSDVGDVSYDDTLDCSFSPAGEAGCTHSYARSADAIPSTTADENNNYSQLLVEGKFVTYHPRSSEGQAVAEAFEKAVEMQRQAESNPIHPPLMKTNPIETSYPVVPAAVTLIDEVLNLIDPLLPATAAVTIEHARARRATPLDPLFDHGLQMLNPSGKVMAADEVAKEWNKWGDEWREMREMMDGEEKVLRARGLVHRYLAERRAREEPMVWGGPARLWVA